MVKALVEWMQRVPVSPLVQLLDHLRLGTSLPTAKLEWLENKPDMVHESPIENLIPMQLVN